MTNEEKIDMLCRLRSDITVFIPRFKHQYCNTLNEIIEELEQQPCEDCIRREEALKVMCDKCPMYNCVTRCSSYRNIEKMPSVTPQQQSVTDFADKCKECGKILNDKLQTRWIPVSERLPEVYEFVNCTCHSLIDDREDWVIESVYIPQPSDSPYSDWGNIPMLNGGDCKVVAWMHRDIPEPYKESEGVE